MWKDIAVDFWSLCLSPINFTRHGGGRAEGKWILFKIVQKYPGDYFWNYFSSILYGMGYPQAYFLYHLLEYFLGYLIKRLKNTLGLFFEVFLGCPKK